MRYQVEPPTGLGILPGALQCSSQKHDATVVEILMVPLRRHLRPNVEQTIAERWAETASSATLELAPGRSSVQSSSVEVGTYFASMIPLDTDLTGTVVLAGTLEPGQADPAAPERPCTVVDLAPACRLVVQVEVYVMVKDRQHAQSMEVLP